MSVGQQDHHWSEEKIPCESSDNLRAMISKQIWKIHYIFDRLGSGLLSFLYWSGPICRHSTLKSLLTFIAFECAAVTLFLTQNLDL